MMRDSSRQSGPSDPQGYSEAPDPLGGGLPWRDPVFVDAIARRLHELQQQPIRPIAVRTAGELMTVAEVAKHLRVNPKWVYAHQKELGAIKLSDGPKARLRFDISIIETRLGELRAAKPAPSSPHERTQVTVRKRRRLQSRPLPAMDRAAGTA